MVPFDKQYPALAAWTASGRGWIEVGYDDLSDSLVRLLDLGGMVWEGEWKYETVEEAFRAAEEAVVAWYDE